MKKLSKIVDAYRVDNGKQFRLKDYDPADTHGLVDPSDTRGVDEMKAQAQTLLADGIKRLAELQATLYAQDRWALLLIFQAMDAAGKDSTIKHVMSGVNPQGVQVYSFKAPSPEELDHDFLWRAARCLPERGRIGIFNRSYYEEVLVVRVHRELLDNEKLPEGLISDNIWEQRFEDINAFERYLHHNGIAVLKFFLNVSKKEQKKRFLARLDTPEKNWKFSAADVRERACWNNYQDAYEDMICNTATKRAPWFVVPADNKWFTRLVVAGAVVDALEQLDLAIPELTEQQRKELEAARVELEKENNSSKKKCG